jgi:Flp pilus assembly pilin Flp
MNNAAYGGAVMRMRSSLGALARDEKGQDLAEYAMALGVIAAIVGLIAVAIGSDVTILWSNAQPALQTVIDATP